MPAYRRTQFLINRPFQFKFTFYVCSWVFAMSVAYPVMIYNLFNSFVTLAAYDPHGPTLAALQTSRHDVLRTLIIMHSLFLVMLVMLNIFVSHRIAGPIFKLKRAMDTAAGGAPLTPITFRKMDHFHELAQSYNALIQRLQGGSTSPDAATVLGKLEASLPSGSPDRAVIEQAMAVLKRVSPTSSLE